MSATQTRERIIGIIATGDSFGAAANIAGEIDAKDKRIAELEGLLRESVATLQDDITKNNALKAAGDALVAELDEARAQPHEGGHRGDGGAGVGPLPGRRGQSDRGDDGPPAPERDQKRGLADGRDGKEGEGMSETLKETIERYAHLDAVLSDGEWSSGSTCWSIARDLWLAAKAGQAEVAAKDARIAELEQLATLSPIKVGDISITLGLTETGEARMTFDGADDATLAVVAGKFALAIQATTDGAK